MKVKLEYRGTLAEPLNFLDKDTGKQVNTQRVVHSCETPEGIQVRVSDPQARTLDLSTYKPPFKKGQIIVVDLRIDPTKPLQATKIELEK